jgi:predicted dehydrogenase
MAPDAYEKLHAEPGRYSGGVLFRYRQLDIRRNERTLKLKKATRGKAHAGAVSIGLIGAGNFATGTLIPALKKCANAHLHTVCSAGGLNAKAAASRHGFEYACSSIDDVFSNDEIDAVVIATRHDTHAKFAMDALRAGKHAFVEKPLALSEDDLDALFECAVDAKRVLMPGFNRRFSPLARAVRDHFSNDAGPLQGIVRVNAGSIDGTSWYQDVDEGGWRIVSEGCHWVDLLSFLLDA